MTKLEGIAHQIAREARIAANCKMPGWAYSVAVPCGLFLDEMQQVERIRSYATRAAEPGELVRIDLDFLDVVADLPALKFLNCMELEPFIIGVGKVRAIETAKGLIVTSGDQGQKISLRHDTKLQCDTEIITGS
jgi:hypothetical protein